MIINNAEYSEPEIRAKIGAMVDEIKRLESEIYALSEKLGDIEKDYNEQAIVVGFLEQDNKRFDDENKELKMLLKLAVDAIYELLDCGAACSGKFCDEYCIYNCETCPLNEENGTNGCGEWRKWKHADEALKLIGEDGDTE